MGIFRFTSREEEPVEFRPVAGMEREWASYEIVQRSSSWDWLGLYPVLALSSLSLLITGIALLD